MKKLLSLTSLLLFVSATPLGVFAECQRVDDVETGAGNYSRGQLSYECNVEKFCGSTQYESPWNISKDRLLVKEHDANKYPDLARDIKGLDEINKIYEDTQNQIFNCAIVKAKHRLHKEMMESEEMSEAFKKVLGQLNSALEKQMKEFECTENNDDTKIYGHKDLLDEVTYEHCVYSFYLNYMKAAARNNIKIALGQSHITKLDAANQLEGFDSTVDASIEHADKIYEASIKQFGPFEQSYPAHVLLQYIEYEMLKLRRYTAVTLKAIVQTFIKAVNTQKSTQYT